MILLNSSKKNTINLKRYKNMKTKKIVAQRCLILTAAFFIYNVAATQQNTLGLQGSESTLRYTNLQYFEKEIPSENPDKIIDINTENA
jgi:hypothetical protein